MDILYYMLKLCKSFSCLEWTRSSGCVVSVKQVQDCLGVTLAAVCHHCLELSCSSKDAVCFAWGLVSKNGVFSVFQLTVFLWGFKSESVSALGLPES